jgi:anti-anti-sigma regulatory factor
MTTHGPGASTLTRRGEIRMLILTGERDLTTISDLDRDMEHVAASGTSVVIDLSEATFIDSQVLSWSCFHRAVNAYDAAGCRST